MIRLDIQPYCEMCCDFESDVIKPEKMMAENTTVFQTDTIIRCRYAKRCENIRRYLRQQAIGELTYD